MTEEDYGHKPKGLYYNLLTVFDWFSDCDPFGKLRRFEALEGIKARAGTGYFEELTEKYFIRNGHCAGITLWPVSGEAKPDTPENLAKVPFVPTEGIKKETETIPFETDGNRFSVPLNSGLSLSKYFFGTEAVPEGMLPLIGILRYILGKTGTANYGADALSNRIDLHFGRFSFGSEIYFNRNENIFKPFLTLSVGTVCKDKSSLDEIIGEVTGRTVFGDPKLLGALLADLKACAESDIMKNGHRYAGIRGLAGVLPQFAYKDAVDGIGFYEFLKNSDECGDGTERLGEELEKVYRMVFGSGNCGGNGKMPDAQCAPLRRNEYFSIPAKVNSNTFGGYCPAEYGGEVRVLGALLGDGYLTGEIRLAGGAYGAGCRLSADGYISVYSYSDPNVKRTYGVFEDCGKYVKNLDLTERELRQAIIGAVNRLDRPRSDMARLGLAAARHFRGIDGDYLQGERDGVLAATNGKLKGLSEWIVGCLANGSRCTVGGGNNRENSGLFEKTSRLV